MAYIIRANQKNYTVSLHAARRMVQRYISEAMVIETLEKGKLTEQPHGNDLYEYEIEDETLEIAVIVRVAVNEETRLIVSVIDNTEANEPGGA